MHKFFTSSYDASIYLQQPEQNTGRDEILEVGKLYYGSTMDIARTLIKFNTAQISQSIAENNATSWSAYINLKSANPPPGAEYSYVSTTRPGNNYSCRPGIFWLNDPNSKYPSNNRYHIQFSKDIKSA
jgi:hypothetical protein